MVVNKILDDGRTVVIVTVISVFIQFLDLIQPGNDNRNRDGWESRGVVVIIVTFQAWDWPDNWFC